MKIYLTDNIKALTDNLTFTTISGSVGFSMSASGHLTAPLQGVSVTEHSLLTASIADLRYASVSSVSTISGEVSTIQGEVSTIQGEVSTLQGEVSGIDTTNFAKLNSSNTFDGYLTAYGYVATNGMELRDQGANRASVFFYNSDGSATLGHLKLQGTSTASAIGELKFAGVAGTIITGQMTGAPGNYRATGVHTNYCESAFHSCKELQIKCFDSPTGNIHTVDNTNASTTHVFTSSNLFCEHVRGSVWSHIYAESQLGGNTNNIKVRKYVHAVSGDPLFGSVGVISRNTRGLEIRSSEDPGTITSTYTQTSIYSSAVTTVNNFVVVPATDGTLALESPSTKVVKYNISELEYSNIVDLLVPVRFTYKLTGKESVGLIAEDLIELGLTELVNYAPVSDLPTLENRQYKKDCELYAEGKIETKPIVPEYTGDSKYIREDGTVPSTVNYELLAVYLIKEIQEIKKLLK